MEGEEVLMWSLSLCSLFVLLPVTTASYQVISWRGPVQIKEYSSIVDATFFEATVPRSTWQARWHFQPYKSSEECEDRTIYVEARFGSFPLLRPNNESFPSDFSLQHTRSWSESFSTANMSLSHVEKEPLPGQWYVAYFINDYVDDSITQKGLGGMVCSYFVETEILVNWLEHVEVIETNEDKFISVNDKLDQVFRVLLSELTWQAEITVDNCNFTSDENDQNSTTSDPGCPLMISFRGEGLPQIDDPGPDSFVKNCSGLDPCVFTVSALSTNSWNNIRFKSLLQGNVNFTINIGTKDCERHRFFVSHSDEDEELLPDVPANSSVLRNESWSTSTYNVTADSLVVSTPVPTSSYLANATNDTLSILTIANKTAGDASSHVCVWLPELGRGAQSSQSFKRVFQLHAGQFPLPNKLHLPDDQDVIMKFTLNSASDTGGTLRFTLSFANPEDIVGLVGTVEACIQRGRIPTNESSCYPENQLFLSSVAKLSTVLYFPYPEAGSWYISLRTKCYTNSSDDKGMGEPRNCSGGLGVDFGVAIDRCVRDGCGKYGRCAIYRGDVYFSACQCYARWRGYGCTDGTVAETDVQQITAVLLLTLSNLAFMPCIIVSLYRRFFLEALVYFFTMFFSTFYHACDGDRAYFYCMIPYNTLAICDFYGAIMSFWVTLVAMSKLTEPVRSFLYILASLGLALGVTWDRHSLWTFLVPAGVAFIIMAITWGLQMKASRSCYPSKKSWLFRLIPGIVLALLGLFVYAFLETQSNYQYTHSSWHACMALCVVFLLPPKRLNKDMTYCTDSPSESHLHDNKITTVTKSMTLAPSLIRISSQRLSDSC